MYALNTEVKNLEKDVDELDYVINFCEENLEIKAEEKPDEEEKLKLQELKYHSENFNNLQYFVLVEKYKLYFENVIKGCYPQADNKNNGIIVFK